MKLAMHVGSVAIVVLIASCGSSSTLDQPPTDSEPRVSSGAITQPAEPGTAAEDPATTETSASAVPASSSTNPPTTSTTSPAANTPALTAVTLSPAEPVTPADELITLDVTSARVTATVTDLADRLDLSPDEITIVEARAVRWGDSSLGCPMPGRQYLPQIVDGSLVVLGAAGRLYEYHGGTPLLLCADPAPPASG